MSSPSQSSLLIDSRSALCRPSVQSVPIIVRKTSNLWSRWRSSGDGVLMICQIKSSRSVSKRSHSFSDSSPVRELPARDQVVAE
jgi:hypothetical protein